GAVPRGVARPGGVHARARRRRAPHRVRRPGRLRPRPDLRAGADGLRRPRLARVGRRRRRAAALPARPAAPSARAQRLPEVLPPPRRQRLRVRGLRGAGHRAARAREPARGLERVPGHDGPRPHARGLLPGLPRHRRPRAAPRGRRADRPGRRVLLPPRALGRSRAAPDVPHARARAHRRAGGGLRVARRLARPLDRAAARPRARRGLRRGGRSVLRAQRAHARRQPARAGAEVRDPRADRRPRADRDRVVQLPPGPLRQVGGDRARRRRRRPHRLPRLRPRAGHARAPAHPRPRPRVVAAGRPGQALGRM
ncbi:MAG: Archaeal seryl-tRNA synthetase-related sequence, partial [uncultured Solirubrobacteraceae bacterium]